MESLDARAEFTSMAKTIFFKLDDFLMNHNGRLYMVQLLNLHLYVLFKPYKYYTYILKNGGDTS